MACEHKTLRPLQENPELLFCLECGNRFSRKELDLTAFSGLKPKPIEEKKVPEIATIQLFLTREEYDWLVWELKKKVKGCDYMLTYRASTMTDEKKAKITRSGKISKGILNKLEIK